MTTLMAIGGAVDFEEPVIFEEFVKRSGGAQARILILPHASSLADTGKEYTWTFQKLGVKKKPLALEFRERKEADKKRNLEAAREATGIFIAGGTQIRLTSLLGGTKFEEELLAACRRGAVIAGTSAGTAVQSKVMIAYGRGGPTPRERNAQFSPGFGFTDRIIFDQHIRQRDRLGRLIYAISMPPGSLGVGVDENTAAPADKIRVAATSGPAKRLEFAWQVASQYGFKLFWDDLLLKGHPRNMLFGSLAILVVRL